jgi:hypothetical protein
MFSIALILLIIWCTVVLMSNYRYDNNKRIPGKRLFISNDEFFMQEAEREVEEFLAKKES